MLITFSINGVPVRLTDERWQHIVNRHPELENKKEGVLNAVSNPELIQKGDFGTLIAIKSEVDRYLAVIYKEVSEVDGFIITAYYTKEFRRRLVAWKS